MKEQKYIDLRNEVYDIALEKVAKILKPYDSLNDDEKEKIMSDINQGIYDDQEIEIEKTKKDMDMPIIEVVSGGDEASGIGSILDQVMSNVTGKNRKLTTNVKNAIEIFINEEVEKKLDLDSLNEEVIEGCEKLKLLSVAFTGVDHIPLDLCKEKGICVCNCAGYSTAAVSDLVFGMLISLYRRLAQCDTAVRNQGTKDGLVGFELEAKKFGVIGAGAIGTRVARIAKAFGCEVYIYSRTEKEIEGAQFVLSLIHI